MNKRALHHTLVKLQLVTLWQLVIVLFVSGSLSAVFLRQNNLHMLQLRNQLKQADEQNKDIPQALTNLGQYITTHMNTSMGDSGVYLQQSYERAYTQAIQKAAHGGTANEAVYQHADEDCQASFSRAMAFQGYIQCVSDEILASAGQEGLKALQVPAADLYRYNLDRKSVV